LHATLIKGTNGWPLDDWPKGNLVLSISSKQENPEPQSQSVYVNETC